MLEQCFSSHWGLFLHLGWTNCCTRGLKEVFDLDRFVCDPARKLLRFPAELLYASWLIYLPLTYVSLWGYCLFLAFHQPHGWSDSEWAGQSTMSSARHSCFYLVDGRFQTNCSIVKKKLLCLAWCSHQLFHLLYSEHQIFWEQSKHFHASLSLSLLLFCYGWFSLRLVSSP